VYEETFVKVFTIFADRTFSGVQFTENTREIQIDCNRSHKSVTNIKRGAWRALSILKIRRCSYEISGW
jgi:hypothetical protein